MPLFGLAFLLIANFRDHLPQLPPQLRGQHPPAAAGNADHATLQVQFMRPT